MRSKLRLSKPQSLVISSGFFDAQRKFTISHSVLVQFREAHFRCIYTVAKEPRTPAAWVQNEAVGLDDEAMVSLDISIQRVDHKSADSGGGGLHAYFKLEKNFQHDTALR